MQGFLSETKETNFDNLMSELNSVRQYQPTHHILIENKYNQRNVRHCGRNAIRKIHYVCFYIYN